MLEKCLWNHYVHDKSKNVILLVKENIVEAARSLNSKCKIVTIRTLFCDTSPCGMLYGDWTCIIGVSMYTTRNFVQWIFYLLIGTTWIWKKNLQNKKKTRMMRVMLVSSSQLLTWNKNLDHSWGPSLWFLSDFTLNRCFV